STPIGGYEVPIGLDFVFFSHNSYTPIQVNVCSARNRRIDVVRQGAHEEPIALKNSADRVVHRVGIIVQNTEEPGNSIEIRGIDVGAENNLLVVSARIGAAGKIRSHGQIAPLQKQISVPAQIVQLEQNSRVRLCNIKRKVIRQARAC